MSEKASSSSLLEAIKLKLGKLPKATEEPEKKPNQNYFSDSSNIMPSTTENSEKTELFEGLKNIENIENISENTNQEFENDLEKDLDDESVNVKNLSSKINNKTNLKEVNYADIDNENHEEDIEEIKSNEPKIEAPKIQKPEAKPKEIDPIELELQKLEAELEIKKNSKKPEIKIEDLDLTEENLSKNTSPKPQEIPKEIEQNIIETKTENETSPVFTNQIANEIKNQIIEEQIIENPEPPETPKTPKTEEAQEINLSENNPQLPDSKEVEILENENVTSDDSLINTSENSSLPQNPDETAEDNFHELRSKIGSSSSFNFSPTLKYLEEIEQNSESKIQENNIINDISQAPQVNETKAEDEHNLASSQDEFQNEIQKTAEIKTDYINSNIETNTINTLENIEIKEPEIENIEIKEPEIENIEIKEPEIENIEIKEPEIENIEIKADNNISEIKNAEIKQFKLEDYKEPANQDVSVDETMSYKIQDLENELIKNSMNAIRQELTSTKLSLEDFDEGRENNSDNLSLQSDFNNPNLEKIRHNLIHEETIYQSTNSIKKLMEAKNIVKKINDSFGNDELLNKIAMNLMEPKLEKWLNDNLPKLVEEIVRTEIEKIIPK